MNLKLLNEIQKSLDDSDFDLAHESNMAQARILSPFIEIIESEGITQEDLESKTGLSQPFLSAILNIRKKLNMEHIALLQNALGVVLQPPTILSKSEHSKKFYSKNDYDELEMDKFAILPIFNMGSMFSYFPIDPNRTMENVSKFQIDHFMPGFKGKKQPV